VIDRALVRIMSGDYGRCVSCGQPIPAVRLVAVPAADECHRA
jgi:RNA polymerase-binding transcription factor DksA